MSKASQRNETAYALGKKAKKEGKKTKKDNPYGKGTSLYHAWFHGWLTGEKK